MKKLRNLSEKPLWSLKTKLLLYFIVPVLFMYFLLIYGNFQIAKKSAIENLQQTLITQTQYYSRDLDQYLLQIMQTVQTIANSLSIAQPENSRLYYNYLRQILHLHTSAKMAAIGLEPYYLDNANPNFAPYAKRDNKGFITDGELISEKKQVYFEEQWYKTTKQSRKSTWITPYTDHTVDDKVILTYAVPLIPHDKFIGTLAIHLTLETIEKKITSFNTIKNGYPVLLSKEKLILSHPNSEYSLLKLPQLLAEKMSEEERIKYQEEYPQLQAEGNVQGSGITYIVIEDKRYWIAYSEIPSTGWQLTWCISEESMLQEIHDNLYNHILFMSLFCIIFIACTVFILHKEILAPMKKIVIAIDHLANEDLSYQIGGQAPNIEFKKIFQSYNENTTYLKVGIENVMEKQKAEAESKAKSDFLARMSHEIRTPLNAILGLSYIALQSHDEIQQYQYLEKIHASGTNILNMVNDILDYSKIEAGFMEIELSSFSFATMIQSVIDMFEIRMKGKGLTFKVRIHSEIPTVLKGDATRLSQIIINFLSNAFKFTQEGTISLFVDLLEKTDTEVKLIFTVSDTGIGIPEEAQTKLFDEFTQVDTSTSRKFGGTGLGLSICKMLVTLMGGSIDIKSKLGVGSIFSFTISLQIGEEKEIKSLPILDLTDESVVLQNLKLLLVEDNEINQEIIIILLERLGIHVDLAQNGREATEMVLEATYDIILMDIQMPEMDGYTATRRIRVLLHDLQPNLPIIAMTANAMQSDKDKSVEAGMNDHISKPVDPIKLNEILIYWAKKTTKHRT